MKIACDVDISCKPKDIFPWVANPGKAKKWQKNVKGGEIIKKTKEIVGTKFRETMEENGKTLEMQGEIINYEQDKSIGFHLESKMHKVDVKYVVEDRGKSSKFTMEADIRWKFPMSVISLFIGGKIREGIGNQTKSELAELKRLCETG